MLSRDCDGCSEIQACAKRFNRAGKLDFIYCADGTVHLIDDGSD